MNRYYYYFLDWNVCSFIGEYGQFTQVLLKDWCGLKHYYSSKSDVGDKAQGVVIGSAKSKLAGITSHFLIIITMKK